MVFQSYVLLFIDPERDGGHGLGLVAFGFYLYFLLGLASGLWVLARLTKFAFSRPRTVDLRNVIMFILGVTAAIPWIFLNA